MAALATACDLGDGVQPEPPPELRVVRWFPEDGQGAECAASDETCGVPRDSRIRLEFDRPLLPVTATRQSLGLYTRIPQLGGPFLLPHYDLFDRSVTYTMSGWLLPGTLYQIDLPRASSSVLGFRSFDEAALAADQTTHISFVSSKSPGAPAAPALPVPDCADVVKLLVRSCSGGCCHDGSAPAAGLRLDSEDGLVTTAIRRVARQTDRGNTWAAVQVNPARFGTAMARIAPGEPFSSYLAYKLLLRPENLENCRGPDCVWDDFAAAAPCKPIDAAESQRLRDWFVQGEPMPPSSEACGEPAPPLDCGSVRAIEAWITAGAACE